MRHRATSRLLAGLTVVAVTAVGTGRPAAADPAAGPPPAAAAQITTAQLSAASAGRVTTAVAPAVVAPQSKTGLAVMSPWSLRPAVEPNLTDAQRVAFEDQMIKDLVEAKVKTVRLEIAAPGETAVDFTLYRRLIDKLPSDVKVIAVLNFALVEGGVSDSGVPASEPYLYQLQDSVAVSQYPEYGTTTKFMKVWIDKALSVVTTFGSRLAAVEVLNEANKLYHPGTAAHPGPYVVPGDAYGRLIGKFYRYCRLAGSKPCGSTVKVITHGMHPGMDGGDSGTANDDTFHLSGVLSSASVAAFRAANGGAWPFDGIGYHPYPFAMGLSLPGGYANTATSTLLAGINGRLDAVRAVLTAAGVPQSTSLFWLTEVGFNSNDVSASTLEEKEAKQGQYVKDVFTALANRADTAQAIWYRYHQGNAGAPAENWGLVAHTDRVYSNLPPRYKRAYCDFIWERGGRRHRALPTPEGGRLAHPLQQRALPGQLLGDAAVRGGRRGVVPVVAAPAGHRGAGQAAQRLLLADRPVRLLDVGLQPVPGAVRPGRLDAVPGALHRARGHRPLVGLAVVRPADRLGGRGLRAGLGGDAQLQDPVRLVPGGGADPVAA
ncbi:hypothetical protein ACIA59_19670 [Micromonospora haikouensis]|uniref:hypothetical protein n=1 Tax=Micromonospora haikouensis TaxID=686309 RepID=UPI00379F08BD